MKISMAFVIMMTLVNGFFSVNILNSNTTFYSEEINNLNKEKLELENELNEFLKYGIVVDVTMYQPVWPQTDRTPNITADGTRIKISSASEYKFVALSRNLLKRWGGPFDYGDFILIKGTGYKDGIYQVRDTMNSKWVNMVDILESTHVKPYKFADAHIYKMPWLD
jgi:predicted SpoU family rRNA methylase|tara:strand:+ start:658 stop:1155 length:498 start_codon:yes stop_codon:yes gene_type:complete